MFESLGNQTAKTITDALPGLEKTVSDSLTGIQLLVTQTLVPILADVVSQLNAQCNRLDGATVSVEPSAPLTVTVTIPTFTLRVNMPLKPEA